LLDDLTWSIRYLIVNTSNWWAGHLVLVSPEWINQVIWVNSQVTVALDREAIRTAPVYTEGMTIARDAELAIYKHYGRQSYWQTERTLDAA